jgi:hypothetical protein
MDSGDKKILARLLEAHGVLTLTNEISELVEPDAKRFNFPPGKGGRFVFMTPTFHWFGEIVNMSVTQIQLKDCGFIDNLGAFDEVRKGNIKHFERVPDGMVLERGTVQNWIPWTSDKWPLKEPKK